MKIPCRKLDLLFELSWEKWVRDTNLDVVSLLIVLVFMGMHGIIKEMIRECKEKQRQSQTERELEQSESSTRSQTDL